MTELITPITIHPDEYAQVKKAIQAIADGYEYKFYIADDGNGERVLISVENPTFDSTNMDDPNIVFYASTY